MKRWPTMNLPSLQLSSGMHLGQRRKGSVFFLQKILFEIPCVISMCSSEGLLFLNQKINNDSSHQLRQGGEGGRGNCYSYSIASCIFAFFLSHFSGQMSFLIYWTAVTCYTGYQSQTCQSDASLQALGGWNLYSPPVALWRLLKLGFDLLYYESMGLDVISWQMCPVQG